jgi:hypothetical protein
MIPNDSDKIFQFLSFKDIQPAIIEVKKDSRFKNNNHYLTNNTVKKQKTDADKWKDSKCYGRR